MNLRELFEAHDTAQAAATAAFIEVNGRAPRRGDLFNRSGRHLFYVGDGYRWHLVRDASEQA
jgi:hypothetical protein